jgi:nitrite reductase/ring-hydroxylating ferredoxin subunit
MELPDSIKAIGEQLAGGGKVAPDAELFEAYDVFSAEVANIFTQPWLAVDHASRLAVDGDFVRADVGPRSVVLVRESADKIHAMRNACLHAGYRVCEEESGRAERLFCQYHGWFYALDGRLTEPMLRPEITDRSRFRLPRYPMRIEGGLIFVDPSKVAPEAPPAGELDLGALPNDLAERTVSRRQRYKTTSNWKRLRQFLWSAPELAFAGDACDAVIEYGPLSLVAIRDGDAVLLRLVPRYPGQTELELVQMPALGATPRDAGAIDPIGDALRENADSLAEASLDQAFFPWYWSQMPAPADEA